MIMVPPPGTDTGSNELMHMGEAQSLHKRQLLLLKTLSLFPR